MDGSKSAGVVVFGGTGGLGQAICRDFARQGRKVAFTFRTAREKAQALAQALPVASLHEPVDLTQADQVAALVDRAQRDFGAIETVVYAAGPDIPQPYVGDMPPEQWRATIDADINGFFNVVQASLKVLRAQRSGSLVALTAASTRRYPPRDSLSAVPKAAIEQLVVAVAKEEGRFGIRANCVAPGMIEAGLGQRMLARDYPPDVAEAFRKAVPLRRFGTAEEIAAVVSFLASPGAAYINGQVIVVDGGWAL
ncbi:MAG: SDR family NAD(P)-dependent oxidoreductase [Reyranellaceae bacterium]